MPALLPDRGEATAEMEPLLIAETSRFRGPLTDLAIDPVQKSARFRGSLPSSLLNSLAHLVRSMNCYYSNLIEGHNTHTGRYPARPLGIDNAANGHGAKAISRDELYQSKLAGRRVRVTSLRCLAHRRPALPAGSLPTDNPKDLLVVALVLDRGNGTQDSTS